MKTRTAAVDEYCSRHESISPDPSAGSDIGEAVPPSPSLRDALSLLTACADQLAAGDFTQPNREAVAQYMAALELAIDRCVARLELGCWLDVLCPLKENLQPLWEYVESVEPARVDSALVTAAIVLTQLAFSLQQQPAKALVRDVLLNVMAARVWSWPLPAAARPALRAAFGHLAPPSDFFAGQLASAP